jgi:hypothetical protein
VQLLSEQVKEIFWLELFHPALQPLIVVVGAMLSVVKEALCSAEYSAPSKSRQ